MVRLSRDGVVFSGGDGGESDCVGSVGVYGEDEGEDGDWDGDEDCVGVSGEVEGEDGGSMINSKLFEGFCFLTDGRTDRRTDICECRVAFATEKLNFKSIYHKKLPSI